MLKEDSNCPNCDTGILGCKPCKAIFIKRIFKTPHGRLVDEVMNDRNKTFSERLDEVYNLLYLSKTKNETK